MPLNDSFKSKGGPAKVVKLSAVPSSDELVHSMANAQKTRRRPVFLAWQVNDDKRLLAVTCGMEPGSDAARWVLRDGHEFNSPIIWAHDTADALMIHTLVSDTINEVGPAAEIPEFLRPTQPQSELGQSGAGSAADKDYSLEATGSIFAERYEIIGEIGRGATSTVYKARQTLIDRLVAVKVMHPHLLIEEVNKRRFEQEAKATAALSHVNLVLVHDFGTSPLGRPFIVMDFVDGPSLDMIVTNQGRLSSQQFIDVFVQCCRGLAHAHKKGVIHRDIKPSNIRLYKDDHNLIVAKVLDFGIAKLFTQDEAALKITEVGAVMGSPAFMSPEQSRAESVDHRTDIYSLGVVMFQAATGVLPFKGKDVFATLYKHIYDPTPSFASLGLTYKIPDAVEAIIHKAMEKDPAQRYQGMEELQRDLMRLLEVSNQGAPASLPAPNGAQASIASVPTDVSIEHSLQAKLQSPQAQPVVPMTEIDLLKVAQVITDSDVAKAAEITSRLGGQLSAMLIADGKIERSLLEVAKRCTSLVNANVLDLGRAIILLNYSQRVRLDFDQAVEELGWNLG